MFFFFLNCPSGNKAVVIPNDVDQDQLNTGFSKVREFHSTIVACTTFLNNAFIRCILLSQGPRPR